MCVSEGVLYFRILKYRNGGRVSVAFISPPAGASSDTSHSTPTEPATSGDPGGDSVWVAVDVVVVGVCGRSVVKPFLDSVSAAGLVLSVPELKVEVSVLA